MFGCNQKAPQNPKVFAGHCSFVAGGLGGLCGALGGDRGSLRPLGGINQGAEELDVKARGHAACGLPLDAHHEPVGDLGFVGFDDTIRGPCGWPESFGQTIDRAAVFAVDDDFAFAVEDLDHAAGDDGQGVALSFFGEMAMLEGFGCFPNEIIDEVAVT